MGSGDTGFASEAYLKLRSVWKGLPGSRYRGKKPSKHTSSTPFSRGRDPKLLGDVLAVAADDMGWTTELEQAKVISEWAELVGEVTAPHTRVTELRDGILVVQCDSTTWATELRRMRAHILTRIIETYPGAGIEDLRFLAPGAPSWRYGSRVVPGRGPRDTYG